MEVKYFVCAQSAVVDQATKNVSIYNIIEQITVPTFPAAVPLTIVGHFVRKKSEREKPTLKLAFKNNGKQSPNEPVSFALDFQGKLGARLIGSVQPAVIEEPGVFTIEIYLRARKLGNWEIVVKKTAEETMMSLPAAHSPAVSAKKAKRRKKRI